MERPKIAVLDDYQGVARQLADWSEVDLRARVDVFRDHLDAPDALAARLAPYHALCVMRERTPLNRAMIERLPNLQMIFSTGRRNAAIDAVAAAERGIEILHTGYTSTPTVELTWALILASARGLVTENENLRAGRWQSCLGEDLAGRTLGLLGLGNIGSAVAKVASAFGMNVIAWSQNLTDERASAVGAKRVSKDDLLRTADFVSIHLVLSSRTRALIGATELKLMKPSARLINTSRGPIVVEGDLIEAVRERRIAGAAIDVFDQEPLATDPPLRRLDGLLATPHIGYVSRAAYTTFYRDTVSNLLRWLDSARDTGPM